MSSPLRFGDWTFDGEARELRGRAGPVSLSPKALDLLGALLEKRPRALSKQELRDRLWPRTFVSESNLARLVKEVRHALGDRVRQPMYLRTVHTFGYAFCAEVVEVRRGSATACWTAACSPRAGSPGSGRENILGRFADATGSNPPPCPAGTRASSSPPARRPSKTSGARMGPFFGVSG